MQTLYDDYLISELMLANVKANCEGAMKQGTQELLSMFSALESLRGQVLAEQKLNESIRHMNNFVKEARPCLKALSESTTAMVDVHDQVEQVANALVNTRHNLPVKGARVDPGGVSATLDKNLDRLDCQAIAAKVKSEEKEQLNDGLEELIANLATTEKATTKYKSTSRKARYAALQEASLSLSQLQLDQGQPEDLLLNLPPEPKLIEF